MHRSQTKRKPANHHLIQALGGKCKECGSVVKLEKDHKIAIGLDGPDVFENLQPLCEKCHKKKTRIDKEKIAFYHRISPIVKSDPKKRSELLQSIDFIAAYNEQQRNSPIAARRDSREIFTPQFFSKWSMGRTRALLLQLRDTLPE